MNPESLDSSIQSALSALFPPFEATASIVLCQLFRTIDERYHGDALQCLLDFLIPSKHLLESVQQAACAGYSDVVFRCEGWPLCLHDKTVIQLAPVNPLLLRPGDFYLQVEPFGDQAARIVLKSLLEEGCREVEETPIPETSYPCMFTEDWLQELNEGRHGTPLSRCLLCTDQGVIKLPWAKIAIPEFLDKPKITQSCHEPPKESKRTSVPSHFSSSTLPVEAMFSPARDRMSASLRLSDASSKLIKTQQDRRLPKSSSKPLIKPVGWVSPNSWDSHNYQEIEGDYVDLLDIGKGKEVEDAQKDSCPNPPDSLLFIPVRAPPPVTAGNLATCGLTLQYKEGPCMPCSQTQEITDQDLKCRYRDSYLAALNNPVAFEKGNVDLLAALDEVSLTEEVDFSLKPQLETQKDQPGHCYNHYKGHMFNTEPCQCKHCCEPTLPEMPMLQLYNYELEHPIEPIILKSTPGSSHSHKTPTKLTPQPQENTTCVRRVSDASLTAQDNEEKTTHKDDGLGLKTSGKHKVKVRSLSTVSETVSGSPLLYKLNNRSHSDICPETINSIIQSKKEGLLDQETAGLKCLKKDVQSSRSDITNGPISKLFNFKIEKTSAPHVQLSLTSSDDPKNEELAFRKISGLLEMGIIFLPGSRDKTGRAVVEVLGDRKEWMSPFVSAHTLCELLLYLHSIPRKDVRELGLTLVINARKKPPPPHLYKALLMAQEQALHAVHSIIMLMDKDTFPRPEKQPGLQMDMVTTMKALNKTVETSQLSSHFGGTFAYIHTDWLQFHQRLVSFMTELRGADCLLQKAIKKVDGRTQMDTAQEVEQCIQEQRVLMKEVLEDTRLVTLQREGGAVLARMKREEFRFPQSEDYRDALESVTSLYNQVEEKLHTLVMRSNESLQHLEFLFRLREMENKISVTGMWFSTEGEQRLKDSYTTDDTLVCTENARKHFHLFLTQSKEKQQYASTLVTEAERIVGTTDSSPATDIFRTLVSTFKSNVEEFMLRAEQRLKELDTLAHIYGFCEKVSALTKECSHFLEQVEQGCYSAQTPSTLQMYEERLGGEFSTQHFQAVKAKVCTVGSGASGVMRVWNAAWIQCQEVRHRLGKMPKLKKGVDKDQIQQLAAANSPENKEEKKNEVGEDVSTPTPTSPGESAPVPSTNQDLKMEIKGLLMSEKTIKNQKRTPWFPQNNKCHAEGKQRSREHHSEADLRKVSSTKGHDDFPLHQPLGRSLSEGSYASSHLTGLSGFSPLIVSHKHCQSVAQQLELNLQPIQNLPASHNLWSEEETCQSKKDSNVVEVEGCPASTHGTKEERTPGTLLTSTENSGSNVLKVKRILEELLSTEREYVKALGYVREHYFPELERADVPQDLRGQRGSIFGNLEKLHDFHRHHFQNELENCVNEPFRVGRCFLRHRDNFALYALYSKNKPQSDSLLINHGQTFFKQKQQSLGDKMDLWSYLLKPVQRISKYSLLLQDLMRECDPKQTREIAEVKAALEVVQFQLRHGNNLLAMDAINHCDVNLKEQGQLIRQDEFLVTFRKKKCLRHIFLFQELVLFSKTRKTDVGNDTYIYKQSFKTSDIGMTQNTGESGLCFEVWFRKRKSQDTYTLQAASREAKEAWTKDLERILWEQAIHNREVRMQERVFLGIGNKPFMDIQPSDAAINDRAINYVLMGRENKVLSSVSSCGSQDGLPGGRPKSVDSGSSSSSSSSSGRGSLSPVGYMCEPKRRMAAGALGGYVSSSGPLEEDDLDHEGGCQNLLLDSSESSGESVSGFSSSSHSFHSAVGGGEAEDNSSVRSSIITVKDVAAAYPAESSLVEPKPNIQAQSAEKTQPPDVPESEQQEQDKDQSNSKVHTMNVGKSTEV